MSVTVTGILRDSGGNPAPNKVIKFYTTKGFDGALPSATLEITTSGTGQYDFELSTGIHILSVQYNDSLTKVSKVTVTSDIPSPQTLDSLLAFEAPLLPDEIIIVQGLVAEANAAAVRAETAASSVEGIEAEVESDRQEVANNTAEVAADTAAVADARQEVSDNAAQVAADTITVTNAQADVTSKASQVSTDAAQVSADALSSEENALLAQVWAVGRNPDSTTPSDTNNSKYWSDRAAQFASGALIYGGQFTPTVGAPYPPTTEIDTMYLVNFPDPENTFTYTDGGLSGTTVKNGNAIIYNTPENQFEAQSYVFTGVATVNGKSPDDANNVTINAADVEAYSKGETDYLLAEKANSVDVYTKTESDIRYLTWDLMVGFRFRDSLYGFDRTAIALKGDGTEVLRADFPKLWSVASGIAVSQSLIDADPETYAARYGDGDGAATFTLPNYGLMPWDATAGSYGAAGSTAQDNMPEHGHVTPLVLIGDSSGTTGRIGNNAMELWGTTSTAIPPQPFQQITGLSSANDSSPQDLVNTSNFMVSSDGTIIRPKTNFTDVWIIHGEIA